MRAACDCPRSQICAEEPTKMNIEATSIDIRSAESVPDVL